MASGGRCERHAWCEGGAVFKVCYASSGTIHWIRGIPASVFPWLCDEKVSRLISLLVGNKGFSRYFANPASIRSLILLLYSRCNNVAPYKLARKLSIHPEQLYRIERRLKKLGIYNTIITALECYSHRKQ